MLQRVHERVRSELAESQDTLTELSRGQQEQQASAAELQTQLAALRQAHAAAQVGLAAVRLCT